MGYEEIMVMKPVFWSLETFNLKILLVYWCVLMAFFTLITVNNAYKKTTGWSLFEQTISGTRFADTGIPLILLISLIILNVVVVPFMLPQGIHSTNTKEWQSNYVEKYIKDTKKLKENTLNSVKLHEDRIEVKFVVDGKLVTQKIEPIFSEDVTEPCVTYYKNDKDFSKEYKKGGIYFVEMYLPKDYSF